MLNLPHWPLEKKNCSFNQRSRGDRECLLSSAPAESRGDLAGLPGDKKARSFILGYKRN